MHTATVVRWSATALVGLAGALPGQTLAARVAAAEDGAMTFEFTPRAGVCGDGETFIRTGRSTYYGSLSSRHQMAPCHDGPVQVRLVVERGAVIRVQSWVGAHLPRGARDFGVVPATEAAGYLMTIAARGSQNTSAKAILPAVLADSATVWPALLAIAHDSDTRSRATRREALFWLARYAGGAVAGHRNDPFWEYDTPSTDEELKTQAVFVLSQLPHGSGIPDLLQVARTHPSPRVRGQALFWLSQSDDPRGLELFESILRS